MAKITKERLNLVIQNIQSGAHKISTDPIAYVPLYRLYGFNDEHECAQTIKYNLKNNPKAK
jgi:hypothetical protein